MAETKRLFCVQGKRKRVGSLKNEERSRIVFLFDHSGGDADYVADRCGVIGIQRADVLAVVLAETRRKGPGTAPALQALGAGRIVA